MSSLYTPASLAKPKRRPANTTTSTPVTHHHSTASQQQQQRELTDDQRLEIREAFDLFDTDKDGAIDYHELKVAMRALGFDLKKAEVLKLLRDYDKRGEGVMVYDDFLKISAWDLYCPSRSARGRDAHDGLNPLSSCTRPVTQHLLARDPREEIRRAFELFDDDRTGKISVRNLRRVAKELGEGLDEDELCVLPPPPSQSPRFPNLPHAMISHPLIVQRSIQPIDMTDPRLYHLLLRFLCTSTTEFAQPSDDRRV